MRLAVISADNMPFQGHNHMTDVQINTALRWTKDKIQAAPPKAQPTEGFWWSPGGPGLEGSWVDWGRHQMEGGCGKIHKIFHSFIYLRLIV